MSKFKIGDKVVAIIGESYLNNNSWKSRLYDGKSANEPRKINATCNGFLAVDGVSGPWDENLFELYEEAPEKNKIMKSPLILKDLEGNVYHAVKISDGGDLEEKEENNKPLNPNHWTRGGTGITNFDPKEFFKFKKAIKMYGDKDLIVVAEPMSGRAIQTDYSFHDLNKKRGDLSAFWKVFDSIETPSENDEAKYTYGNSPEAIKLYELVKDDPTLKSWVGKRICKFLEPINALNKAPIKKKVKFQLLSGFYSSAIQHIEIQDKSEEIIYLVKFVMTAKYKKLRKALFNGSDRNVFNDLIEAQDKYIKALEEELGDAISICIANGYNSNYYYKAVPFRKEIAAIKKEL